MKRFVLDTDIGVDCDDAAAIALMLNLQKQGKGKLLAVTTSTTRKGATAAVGAICCYYGATDMPIGRMTSPILACDARNNYAEAVMKKFGAAESETDGVNLLRKILAGTEEKVTLVAIGPLTNICKLLKSAPDEISERNGWELVREKTDGMFVMGGAFAENYDGITLPKKPPFGEWNIVQDIASAQFVADNFPVNIVFCPHEAGNYVLTDLGGSDDNPVWYSMRCFAAKEENNPTAEGFKRMSWDPVTCLVAMEGVGDYFDLSDYGRVHINDEGITVFDGAENRGHRFLRVKGGFGKIAERINALIGRNQT